MDHSVIQIISCFSLFTWITGIDNCTLSMIICYSSCKGLVFSSAHG